MNKDLKIATFNVQSLVNKVHEVNYFLSSNKLDILCLNETFLNENTNHINLLKNFTITRNDRPTRGGGVAFIIKNNISFKILEKKSTADYELLVISLENNALTIVNVYTHPKSNTNYKFLEKIASKYKNLITVGDFNATNTNWFCPSSNKGDNPWKT